MTKTIYNIYLQILKREKNSNTHRGFRLGLCDNKKELERCQCMPPIIPLVQSMKGATVQVQTNRHYLLQVSSLRHVEHIRTHLWNTLREPALEELLTLLPLRQLFCVLHVNLM